MQAIPLLGWLADRRGWTPRLIPFATLAYAGVTYAVFAQAMAGLPLIRL